MSEYTTSEDKGISDGLMSNRIDQAANGNISRALVTSEIKENLMNYSADNSNSNSGDDGSGGNGNNNNYNNNSSISQTQKRQMLFQKKRFGENASGSMGEFSSVIGGSTDLDGNGTNDVESLLFSQDQGDRYDDDYGVNADADIDNRHGRRGNGNSLEFSRYNRDNRSYQYENSIRLDMFRECTFKPQIKDLPQSLYPEARKPAGEFYDRVTKWQNKMDKEAQSRKANTKASELDGCTWHPKICRASEKAALQKRSNENITASVPIGERLYKHAEKAISMKKELVENYQKDRSEKEKQVCTFKPDLAVNRGAYADVNAKHMFSKPKPHTQFTPGKERATSPYPMYELSEREKKECTFSPKVNKIGKKMNSAKVYLKENVVSRLARPMSPGADDAISQRSVSSSRRSTANNADDKSIGDASMSSFSDRPAVDASAFLINKGRKPSKYSNSLLPGEKRPPNSHQSRPIPVRSNSPVRSIRPQSAGNALKFANSFRTPVGSRAGSPESTRSQRGRSTDRSVRGGLRSYSAPRERTMSASVAPSQEEMDERFNLFIQRQRNSKATWDKQKQVREKLLTPSFKPTLKSNLYDDNIESSAVFLQRVEADILKRTEKKAMVIRNTEEKIRAEIHTPAITRFAVESDIQPKYAFGITKEELELKRFKTKQQQDQFIQNLEKDATYHPIISKLAMSKESQLAKEIATGSGKFLEKFRQKKNGLSEAQFQMQMKKEEEEMKECTFVPRHSILPGYIKRMADSLKLIRSFKKENEENKATPHIERWKS